ncbi:beta-lactamase-like protein [Mycena epipterygia]|nr:beta-lactamase-like protein [Mycena epipterygia]
MAQVVQVRALVPGHFYLPDKEVFQTAFESGSVEGSRVPTFAFLIEHPTHGKLMFDLGLRKHAKGYPPAWDSTLEEFKPECDVDAADILRAGGIEPSSINAVVFSHLHFDHSGDIEPFTAAEIILGSGARPLFAADKTYPADPEAYFPQWPNGRTVTYLNFSDDPPPAPMREGSCRADPAPLGGLFPDAVDLYADASLYVVSAPGHFPGHIALLARVAADAFVLLAADCCHNRLCYAPGELLISQENYDDVELARSTVRRLVEAGKRADTVIILAHEKEREGEMPLFPEPLTEWVLQEVAARKAALLRDTEPGSGEGQRKRKRKRGDELEDDGERTAAEPPAETKPAPRKRIRATKTREVPSDAVARRTRSSSKSTNLQGVS